jgi:hypothetical protein
MLSCSVAPQAPKLLLGPAVKQYAVIMVAWRSTAAQGAFARWMNSIVSAEAMLHQGLSHGNSKHKDRQQQQQQQQQHEQRSSRRQCASRVS